MKRAIVPVLLAVGLFLAGMAAAQWGRAEELEACRVMAEQRRVLAARCWTEYDQLKNLCPTPQP